MIQFFRDWYTRNFSDPQAILLAVFVILSFAIVIGMGKMLAPALAALVIAYLLEGAVARLQRWGLPRLPAVWLVFLIFMAFLLFLVVGLMPVVMRQLSQFVQELPSMINNGRHLLERLPEQYPQFVTEAQIDQLIGALKKAMTELGQSILSISLASIPVLITVLVYLILVPLLVFFFLKDKEKLMAWVGHYLPREHSLLLRVAREMDQQMGNYVRGKIYEIIIVGGVSYLTFAWFELRYASLLGLLVGLSVIIPYIGATVVTLPVALVAFFQWGLSAEFGWLMGAYLVIQALDGNVLVPLLFSEAVNLHPVAIILAILIFGGFWGFWGVFFAIPLATLVKAILNAWPRPESPQPTEGQAA
ncbi:MAG: AI-2E family transporter [Gammaproteobacteria bacterium]|nr:MAG: AI-2E family transporter [Gammaproteobacteria bacterium]